MFNIGGGEVLVIALVALIVVGPEQLPGVLRKAGQYASQLRSMTNSVRNEFMSGVEEINPTNWDNESERGSGTEQKPIVPRGYAERKEAGEPDNPFADTTPMKPVTRPMPDAAAGSDDGDAAQPAADETAIGETAIGETATGETSTGETAAGEEDHSA